MIHCIGDSHSAVFSGEETMQPVWPESASNLLPYFKSYRIGAATAYQLHRKKEIIESILDLNLTSSDSIMFCFGEVDIRAHLIKQSHLQSIPIENIVKECVDRYIDAILYYQKYNVSILVWAPIASWNKYRSYTGPSFGTNIERNKVTEKFNTYLKQKCDVHGFKFISIFEEMLYKDYTTKQELLDDWKGCHIHLSQRAMPIILNKFKVEGIIHDESLTIRRILLINHIELWYLQSIKLAKAIIYSVWKKTKMNMRFKIKK